MLFQLVLAITLAPFFCLAQTDINAIDNSVKQIKTKLSSFQKIEKINSKDGTRSVFIYANEVKLITVKALDASTEKNVEWYYVDGQLVYCETNWLDAKTKSNVFNEKLYLHDGHLLRWTNSRKQKIDPASDEFKKMERELVSYGTKIRNEALK